MSIVEKARKGGRKSFFVVIKNKWHRVPEGYAPTREGALMFGEILLGANDHLPTPLRGVAKVRRYIEPLRCCVYFLVRGREVLYVGQTRNLAERITAHKRTKKFDRVFYLDVAPDKANEVEQRFIQELRPPLNVVGVVGNPYIPSENYILRQLDESPQQTYYVVDIGDTSQLAANLNGVALHGYRLVQVLASEGKAIFERVPDQTINLK